MNKPTLILLILLAHCSIASANFIPANPNNYAAFLTTLTPGDTLFLEAGNYLNRLNVYNISGTAAHPIVIMGIGAGTVFLGNACCNTVSLKAAAYVVIRDLKIDGQNIDYVDAVKAEGTAGNWAHHITLENLLIVRHGPEQQTVGISTKCPAWDWVIRGCTIDAAGTGLYLGNSDGSAPFVNGLIENNLVKNCTGYGMEIKHQNVGSRNIPGMTLNGFTIIRHNVFSKAENASSGADARPNMLVGAFPASGDGAADRYEIYGNFFWQNPYESLVQANGNVMFYNNIGVNYLGGNGFTFQSQNGFAPRDLRIFNNTVVCDVNWSIRLLDTDPAYPKYLSGNAVFSNHATPIRITGGGVAAAVLKDNITDGVANAGLYVHNAANDITTLDLYPIAGSPLQSTPIDYTLFTPYTAYQLDFNAQAKGWTYRGAYAGEGLNPGWHLALEQQPIPSSVSVSSPAFADFLHVFPNPAQGSFQVRCSSGVSISRISVYNGRGERVLEQSALHAGQVELSTDGFARGMYVLNVVCGDSVFVGKVLVF